MRSMTGYGSGSAEATGHQLNIQIEMTSVNRKTLDLNLSAPKEWAGLDQRCAGWLKGHFERGRVQIQVKVTPLGADADSLAWDDALVGRALDRLQALSRARDIPFEPDARLLFELSQNLKDSGGLPDWRELENELRTAFSAALADINSMREREARSLQADLQTRVAELTELLARIETSAKALPVDYKTKLLERLAELGLDLDLRDERVLKEVALFADRSDISEEITRLKSHFEQFHQLLDSEDACGRKLDFLCQEIHREFNTTGSKAHHIDITRAVIDGKNALERIREQVQNIE
ncbi:MAG: YicC/YloC family endoribonuclease [Opitutales bacterium]